MGVGGPAWSQGPAQGPCSAGAHAPGEVSALCQAGHWSGQMPGPACARPNSGARLPCQGTPASGARRTVPVPWTWKSLTFRTAGAGLLGPVQLISGGQGFGLTQHNSPRVGTELADCMGPVEGAGQRPELAPGILDPVGWKVGWHVGPAPGALQLLPGRGPWERCVTCGAGLEAGRYRGCVWGRSTRGEGGQSRGEKRCAVCVPTCCAVQAAAGRLP